MQVSLTELAIMVKKRLYVALSAASLKNTALFNIVIHSSNYDYLCCQ